MTRPGRSRAVRRSPARSRTATRRPQADLGLTLRVWVTARNSGGAATAISDHTFPTVRVPLLGPAMTTAPAIKGKAELGRTLTATRGTWRGFGPDSLRRGLAALRRDARRLPGREEREGAQVHRLTRADLGYRIRLSVVAANSVGSVRARSVRPSRSSSPARSRRVAGSSAPTEPDYIPGGGGDDQLFGRGGSDTIVGGAGDDRLDGGPRQRLSRRRQGRATSVSAGPGSDTVLADDGEADRISCGDGNDRVMADPADVVAADCESVIRSGIDDASPDDDEPRTRTTTTAGPSARSSAASTRVRMMRGIPASQRGNRRRPSAPPARPRPRRPRRGCPRRDRRAGARRRARAARAAA